MIGFLIRPVAWYWVNHSIWRLNSSTGGESHQDTNTSFE